MPGASSMTLFLTCSCSDTCIDCSRRVLECTPCPCKGQSQNLFFGAGSKRLIVHYHFVVTNQSYLQGVGWKQIELTQSIQQITRSSCQQQNNHNIDALYQGKPAGGQGNNDAAPVQARTT